MKSITRQIELLYEVSRHGGIARAATGMPFPVQQSGISKQLIALESELGVTLFVRRPFSLTPVGAEFVQIAQAFFSGIEATVERIRRGDAPVLRIAAPEHVLCEYLQDVIAAMKARFPQITFGFHTGHQQAIETALCERQAHFGIAPITRPLRAGINALTLVRRSFVLWVPADSPIRSASALLEPAASRPPLVTLPPSDAITRQFEAGLKVMKIKWPVSIQATSLRVLLEYVSKGYGVGLAVADDRIAHRTDVRPLPVSGFEPVEIAALWAGGLTPLQEALRAAVRAQGKALSATKQKAARD